MTRFFNKYLTRLIQHYSRKMRKTRISRRRQDKLSETLLSGKLTKYGFICIFPLISAQIKNISKTAINSQFKFNKYHIKRQRKEKLFISI